MTINLFAANITSGLALYRNTLSAQIPLWSFGQNLSADTTRPCFPTQAISIFAALENHIAEMSFGMESPNPAAPAGTQSCIPAAADAFFRTAAPSPQG